MVLSLCYQPTVLSGPTVFSVICLGSVCLRLQVLSIGGPSLALMPTVPLKDGPNSPQRLAEPKGFHYACFHWLQLRNEDAVIGSGVDNRDHIRLVQRRTLTQMDPFCLQQFYFLMH